VLWLAVKCWLNILHIDKEYVAREYYGRQVINLTFGTYKQQRGEVDGIVKCQCTFPSLCGDRFYRVLRIQFKKHN
jgi:hypothetical protein